MLYPEQVQEKRNIRRRSNLAGFALLLTTVLSVAAAVVMGVLQVLGVDIGLSTEVVDGRMIAADLRAYLWTNTVYYAAVIGIPAVVGLLFLRSSGAERPARRPLGGSLWCGYLAVGMGLCVFANVLAYAVTAVFAGFSLYPAETPVMADGSWQNWLLATFSLAVLPAVCEELLFRGVVIGLLKPAGERVAVLLSAVLFALAHGTLTQIPFAFVLGLVFGYLYLRTGNLLLPMVLHFLNNAMSVTLETASVLTGDQTGTVIAYTVFAVLALAGAVAAVFLRMHPEYPLQAMGESRSVLPHGERAKAAWLSPIVLVFLAASLLMLPLNVDYDPDRAAEAQQQAEQTDEPKPTPFLPDGNHESAVIVWP